MSSSLGVFNEYVPKGQGLHTILDNYSTNISPILHDRNYIAKDKLSIYSEVSELRLIETI